MTEPKEVQVPVKMNGVTIGQARFISGDDDIHIALRNNLTNETRKLITDGVVSGLSFGFITATPDTVQITRMRGVNVRGIQFGDDNNQVNNL